MTGPGSPSPWPGVRVLRHVAVPMRDGTTLRADVYLPDRGDGPWPTVIDYLPYRKDDLTAVRWKVPVALAQHGIAAVRLDVRGTGSSDGTALDEYSETEIADGVDAVHWFARQPWSTGRVGLWGTSYGAFNALQIAMERPAPLAAIVAHAGSDDRYATDVHYWGGCLQALELLSYPLWMIALPALPADPVLAGSDWLSRWRERVERHEPWLLTWLRHQRRDDYWQRGSLAPQYGRVACPVFVVSAWHDGYTDAAWRMLEHLPVPRRGLIGPWTHERPDASPVGPRVDFVAEQLRWWRRWLLETPDEEAMARIFMQEAYRPQRFPSTLPGRWFASHQWPPPGVRDQCWYATVERTLSPTPQPGDAHFHFTNDVRVGLAGPTWCPTSPPDSLADDQRVDDCFALTFDSPPLGEPLRILCMPVLCALVAAECRTAFLCVRLEDVWPDGAVTLITRGALNLTRRNGLDRNDPLPRGEWMPVQLPLKACAYTVPAGHRLRLAVSGADFPTLWPAPYRARQLVRVGGRALELRLPVLVDSSQLHSVELSPPTALPKTAEAESARPTLEQIVDHLERRVALQRSAGGIVRPLGSRVTAEEHTTATVWADFENPARCRAQGEYCVRLTWPEGTAEVNAVLAFHSSTDRFHVEIELEARWNGGMLIRRRWHDDVARDGL